MAVFRIKYTRKDMACPCFNLKYAHTAKEAEKLLKTSLSKKNVTPTIIETKEILD